MNLDLLVPRKYTSSLTSLQKRVISSRGQIEGISYTLNQKISQLESVQRLKNAAQEKLDLEIQNKEKLESEAEFAATEAVEEFEKPKPKMMIFDKPFIIFLKRKDAEYPYFGVYIANDELLIKK